MLPSGPACKMDDRFLPQRVISLVSLTQRDHMSFAQVFHNVICLSNKFNSNALVT